MIVRRERRWNKRAAALDTLSSVTGLSVKQPDIDFWDEAMNKIEWCIECENQNNELLAGVDDEESEEVAPTTAIRNAKLPSIAEIEGHNSTHLPFRNWCASCVQGKAVSHPHRKRNEDEPEVPVISLDYMGLTRREPEEGQAPIIVGIDRILR